MKDHINHHLNALFDEITSKINRLREEIDSLKRSDIPPKSIRCEQVERSLHDIKILMNWFRSEMTLNARSCIEYEDALNNQQTVLDRIQHDLVLIREQELLEEIAHEHGKEPSRLSLPRESKLEKLQTRNQELEDQLERAREEIRRLRDFDLTFLFTKELNRLEKLKLNTKDEKKLNLIEEHINKIRINLDQRELMDESAKQLLSRSHAITVDQFRQGTES